MVVAYRIPRALPWADESRRERGYDGIRLAIF